MGSTDSVVLRNAVATLWPDAAVTVDLAGFEAAARDARRTGDPAACAEAAARYGGDLLPDDLYEEWTTEARERARQLHLDVLRGAGQWATVVEIDPTDEAAHRALMGELVAAGRLHAAIRQFQRLRTVLARELGVAPGE